MLILATAVNAQHECYEVDTLNCGDLNATSNQVNGNIIRALTKVKQIKMKSILGS